MKKLFLALTLVAALISIGYQSRTAEAADYYLGVYDDGKEAYLMTETLRFEKYAYVEDGPGRYYCSVKAVAPRAQSYDTVYYVIDFGQMGAIATKNGRPYNRHEMQSLRQQPNSVEMKLINYIKAYHENQGRGSLKGY